jgi:hypothetical protein
MMTGPKVLDFCTEQLRADQIGERGAVYLNAVLIYFVYNTKFYLLFPC